jgi:integrase
MPSPSRHPKTGIYQLRQRVPAHLREAAAGQVISVKVAEKVSRLRVGAEIKVSLGTKDVRLAKERATQVQSQLNAFWASLRAAPARLSHRQVVALAGEAYDAFKGAEDNPGDGNVWARVRELNLDAVAGRNLYIGKRHGLRRRFGPFVDWALERHKLRVDGNTYEALLDQFARALTEVAELLERRAGGDYSPDRVGERFPVLDLPEPAEVPRAYSARNFASIIEAEKTRRALGRDAKPLPDATERKYSSIANQFATFRGEDGANAATVTAADLEAWKVALMSSGTIGNRTVAYKLGVIKTLLGWGKRHFKIDLARAWKEVEEVEVPDFERKPSDLSAIHPDEAVVILMAARRETKDPRKRWLPWLCAYTGLRIGEASSLETRDFFESDGHWFFDVSSSGKRSLKTINARRTIPVHPALIEEGFVPSWRAHPRGDCSRAARIA